MKTSILTLLLGCLGAAAALAQAPPPVSAVPEPVPATPALSAEEAATYVIGPGDQLQVFVWRNPELTITIPVRPDGKISTPLVEEMVAVGKTPPQLARDIEAALGEYIRSPQVSVILVQAVSVNSEVRVVGEVRQARAVPYRSGMTVLDVLLAVGGLNEFAAGNRAKLMRKVDGKDTEIKLKLDDLLNDGDMSQNRPVQPGDVLIVPQSRW